jgi:hypothetical protein
MTVASSLAPTKDLHGNNTWDEKSSKSDNVAGSIHVVGLHLTNGITWRSEADSNNSGPQNGLRLSGKGRVQFSCKATDRHACRKLSVD